VREEVEESKYTNTKSTKENRIIDLRAENNNWSHIKPLVKAARLTVLNPFHLLGSEHPETGLSPSPIVRKLDL
jgi:hypothetical protein